MQCQVIKLAEVACGVGNVLQNKGGIGAFVRVDRTTFLFIAAHLAAHQAKRSLWYCSPPPLHTLTGCHIPHGSRSSDVCIVGHTRGGSTRLDDGRVDSFSGFITARMFAAYLSKLNSGSPRGTEDGEHELSNQIASARK